jgi:DNA (cytosine-5)-methyltransferase 1
MHAVSPAAVCGGRAVRLLWASPDCKHFSKAKGGRPVDKKIRGLAWEVVRWARLPEPMAPEVIILENVEEFKTWGPLLRDGRPDPKRKGQTFRLWVNTLKEWGYQVEWRELRACDYGAPTTRKRLFVIARRDGEAIVWPEATHEKPSMVNGQLSIVNGRTPNGKLPWRTAAECIDWSLPCPSIFERPRPLVENTLARIARGVWRYVIQAKEPFIVLCNHGGEEFRGHGVDVPMGTVTAARDARGLVVPFLSRYNTQKRDEDRCRGMEEPVATLDTQNRFAVVAPLLARICQTGGNGKYCAGIDEPVSTVVSKNEHLLVSAFLAKHYGGVTGHGLERPIGTVTSIDHHSLVAAHLTKFYGTNTGAELGAPMPTVTSGGGRGGGHVGLVAAFLKKYYGSGSQWQGLDEPMHTIVSKARMGLVTVWIGGEEWVITDIGMRMLTPRELARAQGFPDEYVLTGSNAAQIAKIGNSVCPQLAEALVRANVGAPVGLEVAA